MNKNLHTGAEMSATVHVNRPDPINPAVRDGTRVIVTEYTPLETAINHATNATLELLPGTHGENETITVRANETLYITANSGMRPVLVARFVVEANATLIISDVDIQGLAPQALVVSNGTFMLVRSTLTVEATRNQAAVFGQGEFTFTDVTVKSNATNGIALFLNDSPRVDINGTLSFELSRGTLATSPVLSVGATTNVYADDAMIKSAGGGIQIEGPLGNDNATYTFRLGMMQMDAAATVPAANDASYSAFAFTRMEDDPVMGDDTYMLFVQNLEINAYTDMDDIQNGTGGSIVAGIQENEQVLTNFTDANINIHFEHVAVNDRTGTGNWTRLSSSGDLNTKTAVNR